MVAVVGCAIGVCPNDGFYCRRGTFGRAPWNRVGATERDQRCQLVQLDQLGVNLDLLELAAQPRGVSLGAGSGPVLSRCRTARSGRTTSRCQASNRARAPTRQAAV